MKQCPLVVVLLALCQLHALCADQSPLPAPTGKHPVDGAYLEGAKLESANLRGANLCEADLRGADLKDTLLFGARVKGARFAGTNWPLANFKDYDGKDDERLIDELKAMPPEKYEALPEPQSKIMKYIGGVELTL